MKYEEQAKDDTGSADADGQSGTRRSLLTGCLIVLLAGGVVGILLLVALGLFMFTGAVSAFKMGGASGEGGQFREVTLQGEKGQPKVVQVPLKGFMTTGAMGDETASAEMFQDRLEKAREDDDVRAILLNVNSGGGGVTAADIMHQEVLEYREATGQPVVACFNDVAASGAYYVAAGCSKIMAHPTTVTGSIGVMIAMYDATELMDKLGVESDPVVSGKFKDMGSPFVDQSKEEDEAEREIFQNLVDDMYARFVDVVAEGRGMKADKVEEVADGRVFTSQKAKELGLIDSIGYHDDAVERLKKMAGLEEVHLVRYKRVMSVSDIFGRLAGGPRLKLDLGGARPRLQPGQPLYLWRPPSVQE